jgi:hypothetical protein
MSTAELKSKLIDEIKGSDNEDLLLEMYRLIQIENGDVSIYPLTEDQISMVRESQAEVKAGKFLTDEEANKDIDKWLGK